MQTIPAHLKQFGLAQWLDGVADNGQGLETDLSNLARVTAVHKDLYTVHNGRREMTAEATGRLLFGAASPLDLPAVGDWVHALFCDDASLAVIDRILPRRSLLKRKTSGKKIDFQLIAANIDTALIVQSLDGNFNLRRLERYLVMVADGGIEPVLLLSKSDLCTPGEVARRVDAVREIVPALAVHAFSGIEAEGPVEVARLLSPGKTYCLLGSSGVGKTTLLNHLAGEAVFATKAVREKDGKGRHATTRRQLILLPGGAMIVDTPGMRELGNFSVEAGLSEAFAEIAELSADCRFADCTHTVEKGCAVLRAVEEGRLSAARYGNFIRMARESAYQEMSFVEKKRKDRQFGKMVKDVMKRKKDRR